MKKLLLILLFFIGISTSYAQDTFIVEYTSCISYKDGVDQGWKDITVTAVFNEKNTSDVVLYYGGGKAIRYKKTGKIVKDQTKSGDKYQFIECIDTSDGTTVGIQYFQSNETLRVIIAKGWYVEFHK